MPEPRLRMSNRLRAIRDREVRWVAEQTLTGPPTVKVGRIIPKGPYARWLKHDYWNTDGRKRV
jgi:hypothetical protein